MEKRLTRIQSISNGVQVRRRRSFCSPHCCIRYLRSSSKRLRRKWSTPSAGGNGNRSGRLTRFEPCDRATRVAIVDDQELVQKRAVRTDGKSPRALIAGAWSPLGFAMLPDAIAHPLPEFMLQSTSWLHK